MKEQNIITSEMLKDLIKKYKTLVKEDKQEIIASLRNDTGYSDEINAMEYHESIGTALNRCLDFVQGKTDEIEL